MIWNDEAPPAVIPGKKPHQWATLVPDRTTAPEFKTHSTIGLAKVSLSSNTITTRNDPVERFQHRAALYQWDPFSGSWNLVIAWNVGDPRDKDDNLLWTDVKKFQKHAALGITCVITETPSIHD